MVKKSKHRNITPEKIERVLKAFPKLHKNLSVEEQSTRIKLILLTFKQYKDLKPDIKFSACEEQYLLHLEEDLKICEAKIRFNEINNILLNRHAEDINKKGILIFKLSQNFYNFKKELNEYKNFNISSLSPQKINELGKILLNVAEQSLEVMPITVATGTMCLKIDIDEFSLIFWDVIEILFKLYNAYPLDEIPSKPFEEDFRDNNFPCDMLKKILEQEIPLVVKEYNNFLESLSTSSMSFSQGMYKVNCFYGKINELKFLLSTVTPILLLQEIVLSLKGMKSKSFDENKFLYFTVQREINNFSADIDSRLAKVGFIVRTDTVETSYRSFSIEKFSYR